MGTLLAQHALSTLTRRTTLGAALDCVAPFLPDALMSGESFDHTRRVAALFPADAITFFGFECRLGAGDDAVTDCALNLSAAGARALAGDRIGSGGTAWRRIGHFHRRWAATNAAPFADAPATWLEFDAGSREPAPNLLFGYWPGDATLDRPWPWLQDCLLPDLFDGAYPAALRASLDRCFEACPSGTGDFQIGLMLSRPVQAVRLCVFDLPIAALPGYLAAIDWAGDRREVQRLVAAFAPCCDFVGLHFDVVEHGVLPRIGIEPNFRAGSWSRQPHRERRWAGIWRLLSDAGLLEAAKLDALLAWTGHQAVVLDDAPMLLLRGLSHVKLVLGADGQPLAKGYFGIALRDAARGR